MAGRFHTRAIVKTSDGPIVKQRDSQHQKPLDVFENPHEERHIGQLLEDVSKKYGRGIIGLGAAGLKGGPDWSMKRDMLSPRYTTHWDELPIAKAS